MDIKDVVNDAKKLLASEENYSKGLFIATLNDNLTVNVVAHTNEEFSVALITILFKSVLANNMCCQDHFMATIFAMFETLKGLADEKTSEIGMDDSGVRH